VPEYHVIEREGSAKVIMGTSNGVTEEVASERRNNHISFRGRTVRTFVAGLHGIISK
jgi:hypothetical protein